LFSGLFSLGQTPCNYQNGNECPISDMSDSLRKVNNVYPGGDTRCYYNPYLFQVQKGRNADANNLIIFFKAVGCAPITISMTRFVFQLKNMANTVSSSARMSPGGFLQRSADNPFADWTVVTVGYCTGDVGIGDRVTDDGLVQFNGRNNVKAVLSWVYANIPSPDRLLLAGASAGSFSLKFWANPIIQH
jgi:Pectinacetylesterase